VKPALALRSSGCLTLIECEKLAMHHAGFWPEASHRKRAFAATASAITFDFVAVQVRHSISTVASASTACAVCLMTASASVTEVGGSTVVPSYLSRSMNRNGLSGSAHIGRLELVAIAGKHAHVTPRRARTVVSCENT
jgi:hypothetical protein